MKTSFEFPTSTSFPNFPDKLLLLVISIGTKRVRGTHAGTERNDWVPSVYFCVGKAERGKESETGQWRQGVQ